MCASVTWNKKNLGGFLALHGGSGVGQLIMSVSKDSFRTFVIRTFIIICNIQDLPHLTPLSYLIIPINALTCRCVGFVNGVGDKQNPFVNKRLPECIG